MVYGLWNSQKEVASNLCPEILLGFQKVENMDHLKQIHEGGKVQDNFKELWWHSLAGVDDVLQEIQSKIELTEAKSWWISELRSVNLDLVYV